MSMVMTTIWALLAELAGVAVVAGVLYVYWNLMTKRK